MNRLMNLLTFLVGTPLKSIVGELSKAYLARLEADTDEKKLEAEVVISELKAHRDILIKEQERAMTAWIRPAFAGIAFIYWSKIIVWDTVLELGSTKLPNSHIEWFVVLIPSAYFILRPGEKTGETILKSLSFRK